MHYLIAVFNRISDRKDNKNIIDSSSSTANINNRKMKLYLSFHQISNYLCILIAGVVIIQMMLIYNQINIPGSIMEQQLRYVQDDNSIDERNSPWMSIGRTTTTFNKTQFRQEPSSSKGQPATSIYKLKRAVVSTRMESNSASFDDSPSDHQSEHEATTLDIPNINFTYVRQRRQQKLLNGPKEDVIDYTNNTNNNDERYFSACMVTMDDNHFWSEFLAYHYTFLNLRRIIVAIDPRSKTSPTPIFNQWKDLINITQWNDNDFIYDCEKYSDDLTKLHRCRQRRLYHKCSETLKKEQHTTWVAYIDVDEYIVPNWFARPLERIKNYNPNMTIFDILDTNQHMNYNSKYACFPMSRVPVTIQESTPEQVYKDVPTGINATSLMTLRYRYPQDTQKRLPGKSMIDLTRIASEDITDGNHDTHRPFKTHCGEDDVWQTPFQTSFVTYHYPGSVQAFQFRDDPRKQERRTIEMYYEKYATTHGIFEDDSIRFWIQNFVSKVGLDRAKELLKDANIVKTSR